MAREYDPDEMMFDPMTGERKPYRELTDEERANVPEDAPAVLASLLGGLLFGETPEGTEDDAEWGDTLGDAIDSLRNVVRGKLDPFPVGTVIRWKGGRRYNYAALRAGNGLWYITGGANFYGAPDASYERLTQILASDDVSDVYVATEWDEL